MLESGLTLILIVAFWLIWRQAKITRGLKKAHADGRLQFFNDHQALADKAAFDAYLKPLYKTNFAVYAKEPFAGPKAVLAYLARYTHRVAISNRRLISTDDRTVTFKWKDYRAEGSDRYKTMNLDIHEFIRRFLIHVFPKRFHHIRHYGLLANGHRANNVALARRLLATQNHDPRPDVSAGKAADKPKTTESSCPACGGRMIIIEIFEPGAEPTAHHQRAPPKQRIQPS
ncbi:MAG: IS91 family transposase [Geminicoccaceae bacterium]